MVAHKLFNKAFVDELAINPLQEHAALGEVIGDHLHVLARVQRCDAPALQGCDGCDTIMSYVFVAQGQRAAGVVDRDQSNARVVQWLIFATDR